MTLTTEINNSRLTTIQFMPCTNHTYIECFNHLNLLI